MWQRGNRCESFFIRGKRGQMSVYVYIVSRSDHFVIKATKIKIDIIHCN